MNFEKIYPSTIALIYPIVATYFFTLHTNSLILTIGYYSSQLGYVIIASGIISGSFRVFNLYGNLKTIGVGIALLVLGIILSSIGFIDP